LNEEIITVKDCTCTGGVIPFISVILERICGILARREGNNGMLSTVMYMTQKAVKNATCGNRRRQKCREGKR